MEHGPIEAEIGGLESFRPEANQVKPGKSCAAHHVPPQLAEFSDLRNFKWMEDEKDWPSFDTDIAAVTKKGKDRLEVTPMIVKPWVC